VDGEKITFDNIIVKINKELIATMFIFEISLIPIKTQRIIKKPMINDHIVVDRGIIELAAIEPDIIIIPVHPTNCNMFKVEKKIPPLKPKDILTLSIELLELSLPITPIKNSKTKPIRWPIIIARIPRFNPNGDSSVPVSISAIETPAPNINKEELIMLFFDFSIKKLLSKQDSLFR
jgi:hypothetical protein